MKWLLAIVLCGSLFVGGSLYGIEKNQEKEKSEPAVAESAEQEVPNKAQAEGSKGEECEPPEKEEEIPWIVSIASGLGEGIASTFNGIILIFTEFIHAGAGPS